MPDDCSMAAIEALLDHARSLAARRWRGLVWLTGAPDECRSRARALWRSGDWAAPLWVAAQPPSGLEVRHWLAPSKARTRLGGEQGLLVIDAVSDDAGFDPDAFGALAGTLRAGGLLVLMTPPDWGRRPDADYARLAEHPYRAEGLTAHYLRRLARQLCLAPGVVHWPAAGELRLPPLPIAPAEPPPSTDADCLTRDQADAVARLTRLRRRRPLVLTADRGRGKSAALGIACARLLAGGEPRILVTAPRPSAVAALFERLEALCPEGRRQGHAFVLNAGRVAFLPPDELTALTRRGEVGGPGQRLLVDEAAAIPAALLGEWLEAFPRIAFATTVHGYEGSGRGFALRFRRRLEQRTPEWQACHLSEPIRWAAGDPLEALVTRLLLLDAEPGDALDAPPTLRRARRAELANDESRLRELFGLLVQAHYRTTPSDLRRLLDGPGVGIATLTAGISPQAVLVTTDEGGFDAELAERVARGERRPRGHLMAQSLAAHAGCREALSGRLRRVLRIAVHPGQRRRGLGRRLLEAERQRARHDSIDLLGASFGAEAGLIAFWQALGFCAVRLGLTRETATGEHALMVVAPVSARGERLAADLQARFQRQLPGLLAFELAGLEPEVAAALLAEGEGPVPGPGDLVDIDDVAFGHREPALARPALQALARRALAMGFSRDDPDLGLLVAWAFQGYGTGGLVAWLRVSGQREVTARLRQAVAVLRERVA
ncbi:tRNA(Met) cytidine acetyltransferase TmcA [Halomonas heilongjiangensis]|uniref:tRNA(Met) cytidine acetyltransferase TmcA n=1 Tax=Halomonas heilongjiangensis TaxID=1387883 RepID=A0A2N7TGH6_9GAMM|nr:GNAT family N-acetyltransferase [Halomonas heilongjiangensis]PMR67293.1 tRNA cytosine(34) acetyltransferase TmcA [Halomonas heilongjiangensis]PXX88166.1 tRNA cytosine(34) acetyltransferase TmcA [Halomonas heilongjiangensis]